MGAVACSERRTKRREEPSSARARLLTEPAAASSEQGMAASGKKIKSAMSTGARQPGKKKIKSLSRLDEPTAQDRGASFHKGLERSLAEASTAAGSPPRRPQWTRSRARSPAQAPGYLSRPSLPTRALACFLPDFPSTRARSRPNARTPGPGGDFTGSVAGSALHGRERAHGEPSPQERARAPERHGGCLPGPLARTLGPAGPEPAAPPCAPPSGLLCALSRSDVPRC